MSLQADLNKPDDNGPGNCDVCGKYFAERIDGLCFFCDCDESEQLLMDRDMED